MRFSISKFMVCMLAALVVFASLCGYVRAQGEVEIKAGGDPQGSLEIDETKVLDKTAKYPRKSKPDLAELAASGELEAAAGGIPKVKDDTPHVIDKYTLQDCVRIALDRNVRFRAAEYDIAAAQGQLTEAKALLWPVLEYNYRIAPVPTDVDNAFHDFFTGQVTLFNSMHVGVGIPVGTFGQLHYAKHMAEGGVEAAKINRQKSRAEVVYSVKQLYFGILLGKEMIKLLEDADSKLADKIASEEERKAAMAEDFGSESDIPEEKSGATPGDDTTGEVVAEGAGEEATGEDAESSEDVGMDPYDLMQLKLFKVEMERRLEEARQNLELAYDGLRLQMDLEPGEPIELDTDNLAPVKAMLASEEEYIDQVMQQQPEVKLIDIGVETKRSQYKVERLKLLPQAGIGFFMDVGRTTGFVANVQDKGDYNNPFNFTRAGVGLQFKGTIDFHGSLGRIRKARAEYYKASLEGMYAKRALSVDVRKAYFNTKRTLEDLQRAKRAQSMANQMMFVSKMNVDLGVGDSQRYGDALKTVLLTRGVYFKAIFDYNVAMAELTKRMDEDRARQLMPDNPDENYDPSEPSGDMFKIGNVDFRAVDSMKGVMVNDEISGK